MKHQHFLSVCKRVWLSHYKKSGGKQMNKFKYAIEIGGALTKIYVKNEGFALCEPTLVASEPSAQGYKIVGFGQEIILISISEINLSKTSSHLGFSLIKLLILFEREFFKNSIIFCL